MLRAVGSKTAVAGIAIGAALALWAAPQASAAVACGDEIDKDVKLKQNLDCSSSSSDGLEIDADDVTVDLNGYKLIGPGNSYYGVDNSDGHEGLTVKGGTLDGWNYGVYSYYGSFENLSDLKVNVESGGYGLYVYYSVKSTIKDITVKGEASYAVYSYYGGGVKIDDIRVLDANENSTYGVYLYENPGTVSDVRANDTYYGVYASGQTDNTVIKNVVANDTGSTGVYISNSTPFSQYDYTVKGSTANDANSYGFYAQYDVKGGGNRASGAGSDDCYNVPCVG